MSGTTDSKRERKKSTLEGDQGIFNVAAYLDHRMELLMEKLKVIQGLSHAGKPGRLDRRP